VLAHITELPLGEALTGTTRSRCSRTNTLNSAPRWCTARVHLLACASPR